MKEKETKVILLQHGGEMKEVPTQDFVSHVDALTEYILLPDNDSDAYLLIKPSKYLRLTQARISYILHTYFYTVDEDIYASIPPENLKETQLETTDPYEFYVMLWNILKLRMCSEILAGDYFTRDNVIGFLIHRVKIEVDIKNKDTVTFDWDIPNTDISFASLMIKLSSNLCEVFKIPHKIFRNKDNFFRIKKNRWTIINIDEVNTEKDFIGCIIDMTSQVYFDNASDMMNIIYGESLDVILYGYHYSTILEYYPDFKNVVGDPKELAEMDLDTLMATYVFDVTISLHNDKIAFISNLHYFFRYIEGLVAEVHGDPIEDAIAILVIDTELTNKKCPSLYLTKYMI